MVRSLEVCEPVRAERSDGPKHRGTLVAAQIQRAWAGLGEPALPSMVPVCEPIRAERSDGPKQHGTLGAPLVQRAWAGLGEPALPSMVAVCETIRAERSDGPKHRGTLVAALTTGPTVIAVTVSKPGGVRADPGRAEGDGPEPRCKLPEPRAPVDSSSRMRA